ncbi:haloacid dehalogenase [Kitasatospora sp. NPDC006697]|uniref:haloacid dehalogenase n=1 Tax=Kitasatospora sp. NPDC006697 TaxID=3364020 RepID=UPI0036B853BD
MLLELDVLIQSLPNLAEPGWVRPLPAAGPTVALLRRSGLAVGVLAEQPRAAHGAVTPRQVEAVRLRVEQLLGPFDVWALCPHAPYDHCGCHHPAPGLVQAASRTLALPPGRLVFVGARPGTVAAAEAGGVTGILLTHGPEAPPAVPVQHAPGLWQAAEDALTVLERRSALDTTTQGADHDRP